MREPVGTSRWVGASVSRRRRRAPGQERAQRLGELVRPDVGEPRLADEMRREPVLDGRGKRVIGEVGPLLALGAAQEHHPLAPLRQRLRPRQRVEPESGDAAGQRPRGLLGRRRRQRALGERDRPEPPHSACPQRPGGAIEAHLVGFGDARPHHLFHLRRTQRRSREDAGRGGGAGDLGDREEALAGESLVRFEDGTAPVRHEVFAGPAARFRDAIRIGEDEEGTEIPSPLGGGRTPESALPSGATRFTHVGFSLLPPPARRSRVAGRGRGGGWLGEPRGRRG